MMRTRWYCPECEVSWTSHDIRCWHCHRPGTQPRQIIAPCNPTATQRNTTDQLLRTGARQQMGLPE